MIDLNDSNPPEDPFVGKVLSKIHARLRDKAELVKLHLKHYHMTLPNFKRRISHLRIFRIYDARVWHKHLADCSSNSFANPKLDIC